LSVLMVKLPDLNYGRLFAFLAVGGTSAVATLAVRAGLTLLMPFEAAVALAHVFGLTMAFTLNRIFVFKTYEGSLLAAYGRFFLVNLLSLAIATGVSSLMFRLVFHTIDVGPYADYIAHFIGLGSAALPSYLGHANFSFRSRRAAIAATQGPPQS
jgi:putative flippase GtrA